MVVERSVEFVTWMYRDCFVSVVTTTESVVSSRRNWSGRVRKIDAVVERKTHTGHHRKVLFAESREIGAKVQILPASLKIMPVQWLNNCDSVGHACAVA